MVQGTDASQTKLKPIRCTAVSNDGDDSSREEIDRLRNDHGKVDGSNHEELARLRDEVQSLRQRVALLEAATGPEAQLHQTSSVEIQEGDHLQT